LHSVIRSEASGAVYAEDRVTFGPEGIARGFEPASLVLKVSEITAYKAAQPILSSVRLIPAAGERLAGIESAVQSTVAR
jgi:hypothetical protein